MTYAIIEDLYRVPENGKAELVHGELMCMPATGAMPNYAGGEIFHSLRSHTRMTKRGRVTTDNAGFLVNLPNRQSFSPDAAYYVGPDPGMKFFQGAPVFAAEVRSENDYGPAMERAIAEKIADYFVAGTEVVWDVDLLGPDVVKVYRAPDPDAPTIYRRGDVAEAEPAVRGWTMPVDDLPLP